MNNNKIRVVTKLPGKLPSDLETEPDSFHNLVGGNLEMIFIHELKVYNIVLLGNEDARALDLNPNLYHQDLAFDGMIFGPVIASAIDRHGDSISLKPYQVEIARRWFIDHSMVPLSSKLK